MANLFRLIFAALFLLFGFAHASVPSTTGYVSNVWPDVSGATLSAFCSAAAAKVSSLQTSPACNYGTQFCSYSAVVQGTSCYIKTAQTGAMDLVPYSQKAICPENSELVGGQCVCKAGFSEKNGTCQPPTSCEGGRERDASGQCTCKAGTREPVGGVGACVPTDDKQCESFYAINTVSGGSLVQDYRLQGNITNGAQFCMPGAFDDQTRGCKVNFSRGAFMDYGSGNAITEGSFDAPASSVGSACTLGDDDAPKVPNEEKCPSGYTGTVNGVEVCVNKVPDSGVGGGTDETTTDDGTNTTTTRTDTNTTCKDGKCTTTTTVTTTVTNNATGTSTTTTGTNTTTESQPNFCKANPSNKLCGGSGGGSGTGDGEEDPSSFTGACQAGFQCKGDAIQCAIAREQHIRSCKLFDDKSAESDLYQQHKGKEGDQTKDLPGNQTVSIGDKINSSDALNAGSAGLSDLNITVWKTPVTLPLSMLNKYLAAMGNVLLAVSFLLAFRIVARG